MEKVLVFDVSGSFAHFRKYYTTTSPLTFSIPPRTALVGLIGAISGYHEEEYLDSFSKDNCLITVKILEPIKKILLPINYREVSKIQKTKIKKQTPGKKRFPTRVEFIKNPSYRVYFFHKNNEVYERLKKQLQEHKSVYTPCLGSAQCTCNFNFVKELKIELKKTADVIKIDSVCPADKIVKIDYKKEKAYFKASLPNDMVKGRVVEEYRDFIFERNGEKIDVVVKGYYELENGEKIMFM